mgnify:CR=1 FL=1
MSSQTDDQQIGIDLGMLGLIAWLAIFITILKINWTIYKYGLVEHDHLTAGIGAGLICSQAALLIHGMLDAVTWGMVKQ